MRKLYGTLKKAAAVSMAAMMTVPMAAAAEAPSDLDELNAILEAQGELVQGSLLEQTLGLDALSEAVKENGFTLKTEFSLSEISALMLELPAKMAAEHYVKLDLRVDPKLEKWLLEMGAGLVKDQPLLSCSLYGDNDQLTVSIPEFYEGALGMRSGSFLEQYQGSVPEQMVGEIPAGIDVPLDFYLSPEDLEGFAAGEEEMTAMLEERAAKLAAGMSVEKTEADGQTLYQVAMPTVEIVNLYREFFSEYTSAMMETGLMEPYDIVEFEEGLSEVMDVVELAMEDEVTVDFYVQNNLVTKVTYATSMDMNKVENLEAELSVQEETFETSLSVQEEVAEAAFGAQDELSSEMESESETELQTESYDPGNVIHMNYEMALRNPANPQEGFDFNMTGSDGAMNDQIGMQMSWQTDTTATTSVSTLNLKLTENDETIYDGEPYKSTFDAETGDFDVLVNIDDGDDNVIALILDSRFENVVQGSSFDWVIDDLVVSADGESYGVDGTISISAEPGEFAAPAQQRMLFELTEEEFIDLFTEIEVKATIWAKKLDRIF